MEQHEPRTGESAEIGHKLDLAYQISGVWFTFLGVLVVIALCGLLAMITFDSTFIVEQCSNQYPRSGETCFFGQVRAVANPHYATPGAPANYTPILALPTRKAGTP